MKSLQQIWQELKDQGYETDKGSVHSYIEVYEELLKTYRVRPVTVLEIGLFNGHSFRMWKQYFENGNVHGIDCDHKPHGGLADLTQLTLEPGNWYNIHIMDATNAEQARLTFMDHTRFDVIIEDAGHHIDQQVELYNLWKNYLAPGGIYIIEDVQDIDRHKALFNAIGGEVIDRRKIKNRYDDVLVIFRS